MKVRHLSYALASAFVSSNDSYKIQINIEKSTNNRLDDYLIDKSAVHRNSDSDNFISDSDAESYFYRKQPIYILSSNTCRNIPRISLSSLIQEELTLDYNLIDSQCCICAIDSESTQLTDTEGFHETGEDSSFVLSIRDTIYFLKGNSIEKFIRIHENDNDNFKFTKIDNFDHPNFGSILYCLTNNNILYFIRTINGELLGRVDLKYDLIIKLTPVKLSNKFGIICFGNCNSIKLLTIENEEFDISLSQELDLHFRPTGCFTINSHYIYIFGLDMKDDFKSSFYIFSPNNNSLKPANLHLFPSLMFNNNNKKIYLTDPSYGKLVTSHQFENSSVFLIIQEYGFIIYQWSFNELVKKMSSPLISKFNQLIVHRCGTELETIYFEISTVDNNIFAVANNNIQLIQPLNNITPGNVLFANLKLIKLFSGSSNLFGIFRTNVNSWIINKIEVKKNLLLNKLLVWSDPMSHKPLASFRKDSLFTTGSIEIEGLEDINILIGCQGQIHFHRKSTLKVILTYKLTDSKIVDIFQLSVSDVQDEEKKSKKIFTFCMIDKSMQIFILYFNPIELKIESKLCLGSSYNSSTNLLEHDIANITLLTKSNWLIIKYEDLLSTVLDINDKVIILSRVNYDFDKREEDYKELYKKDIHKEKHISFDIDKLFSDPLLEDYKQSLKYILNQLTNIQSTNKHMGFWISSSASMKDKSSEQFNYYNFNNFALLNLPIELIILIKYCIDKKLIDSISNDFLYSLLLGNIDNFKTLSTLACHCLNLDVHYSESSFDLLVNYINIISDEDKIDLIQYYRKFVINDKTIHNKDKNERFSGFDKFMKFKSMKYNSILILGLLMSENINLFLFDKESEVLKNVLSYIVTILEDFEIYPESLIRILIKLLAMILPVILTNSSPKSAIISNLMNPISIILLILRIRFKSSNYSIKQNNILFLYCTECLNNILKSYSGFVIVLCYLLTWNKSDNIDAMDSSTGSHFLNGNINSPNGGNHPHGSNDSISLFDKISIIDYLNFMLIEFEIETINSKYKNSTDQLFIIYNSVIEFFNDLNNSSEFHYLSGHKKFLIFEILDLTGNILITYNNCNVDSIFLKKSSRSSKNSESPSSSSSLFFQHIQSVSSMKFNPFHNEIKFAIFNNGPMLDSFNYCGVVYTNRFLKERKKWVSITLKDSNTNNNYNYNNNKEENDTKIEKYLKLKFSELLENKRYLINPKFSKTGNLLAGIDFKNFNILVWDMDKIQNLDVNELIDNSIISDNNIIIKIPEFFVLFSQLYLKDQIKDISNEKILQVVNTLMVGNGTKSANHEITNSSVESLGESISSDLNFENNNNKIIVSLPIYKFQISEILFNYISLFDETATTASEAKPLGQESRNENGKSATSYRDIDIDWISDDSIALKLKGEIIFVYNIN